jgi:hypothetical protein
MKPSDVDGDLAPSRDREHSFLTGSVSNDESGVLGTVFRNDNSLELSSMKSYGNPEICVAATHRREHPQSFI